MNVSIDNLAGAIGQAVKEYTEDVSAAIDKEVDTTAEKVLKDVRSSAPKRTGNYAKGFTKTNQSDFTGKKYAVWNRRRYMIAHLLEFGHAKRGGKGRVAERPHLRPAYDRHVPQMERNIEDIIRNGG